MNETKWLFIHYTLHIKTSYVRFASDLLATFFVYKLPNFELGTLEYQHCCWCHHVLSAFFACLPWIGRKIYFELNSLPYLDYLFLCTSLLKSRPYETLHYWNNEFKIKNEVKWTFKRTVGDSPLCLMQRMHIELIWPYMNVHMYSLQLIV